MVFVVHRVSRVSSLRRRIKADQIEGNTNGSKAAVGSQLVTSGWVLVAGGDGRLRSACFGYDGCARMAASRLTTAMAPAMILLIRVGPMPSSPPSTMVAAASMNGREGPPSPGAATSRQESLAGGTLTVVFDDQGRLTEMSGAVLGSFFALGTGSEVAFDFENEQVLITPAGGATQTAEVFFAGTSNQIVLRALRVTLTGDSLVIRVEYEATMPSAGEQAIMLEATLDFAADSRLDGALELPGYSDLDLPEFRLERV